MKPFFLISLVSLLSLSILAPTIMTMFDYNIESVYELGEEEGKKEGKKEAAEKDLYFQGTFTSEFSSKESIYQLNSYYNISNLNFTPEIPLPPPELFA
ncbi:hypothetical protein ACFQ1M_13870 [Sungkyunkwania multivorans]|uniref:Uncharacterized protein n=1 Tax=Sungkyunkwania multivorans TaxID=1173618 RepID=A0ABW3D2R5_9FLAO